MLRAVLLSVLLAGAAYAAPPEGVDLDSPIHAWFEHQHSIKGAWCCNLADGHVLDPSAWRTDGATYLVLIEGLWQAVPDDALRDPSGGPNPTGQAIVWYVPLPDIGAHIYCFAPGIEL